MSDTFVVTPLCDCGLRPIADGHDVCFYCHLHGVGFTFSGGVRDGRKSWNESVSAWKAEHLGERINDPKIEPVSRGCWT